MRTFIPLMFLALTACFEKDAADNPTGECVADHDGGFFCYSSPGPDDTYLPDCDAPLNEELWRVFEQANGTAYVIPRPDGMGLVTGICDGDDAELAALFEANALCDETLDSAGVETINSMDTTDALTITHALHENLEFAVAIYGDGYADVTPFAPPEHLVAACEGSSESVCDAIDGKYDLDAEECLDIGIVFTEDDAAVLADLLNDLYGI